MQKDNKKFTIKKGYKVLKQDIQFSIPDSNLAVLTGLNGSGKTTILKYIRSLLR